jgi:phosphatidylglycerophosphate synthase
MVSFEEVRKFRNRINPTEAIEGRGSFGFYVARPLSKYITWLVLQTPMSANHVTTLHLVVGIIGSCALGHPLLHIRLLGCALLYFGFVLDNVDGEVARFRKQVSITGKYLDTITHVLVNTLMYFGFALGVYWDTEAIIIVVLGFLAALFSLRLDVFVMYTEAARSALNNLDKRFDYYANIEGSEHLNKSLDLQYVSKKAESRLTRLAFAAFAYPGSLHIMTIAIVADAAQLLSALHYTGPSLPTLVVGMYGLLLPVRRAVTVRRIVAENGTEGEYKRLLRCSEKTTPP